MLVNLHECDMTIIVVRPDSVKHEPIHTAMNTIEEVTQVACCLWILDNAVKNHLGVWDPAGKQRGPVSGLIDEMLSDRRVPFLHCTAATDIYFHYYFHHLFSL